ncbi:hypothetical protein CDV36_011299 [Fusarium kuroshium]|uniref:Fungal N-terminal domain-containing protein n=1 Tax=Fusarium kuroshium TaxID=2010991 RepID=A0A3M2RV79_9HYPO|nr:hypothetical protein CDV36_011299 [Fusarium kuroshium]
MVVEIAIGAIGLISLTYPAISALNSRTWGVVDELIKTNRAAKDPELFRQLRDELATWDELMKSIDRVKGSDDAEDRALSAVRSHFEEYETVLREMLEYLKQFRDTEDRKEMASIIVDLRDQFKLVRRHRRQVQKWIGYINMIIVSRIHEELNRQHETNSEALKAQSQILENIHDLKTTCGRELLEIRHRIQGLETTLKTPRGHNADDLQIESASTVTDLAEIADDMISICCGRTTESLVSRTTGFSMTSDLQEFGSEIGVRDLFNAVSIKESGPGSSATVSQGTQTTLIHPSHSIEASLTVSNATPTSPRFPFEPVYDDESDLETESENDSFSEARTDSSFTIDHLDDGIEVLDRTPPEEYIDQYTASNAVLKKLESTIDNECTRIAAGSFGQATRGGPEVLTMTPAEWGSGVSQGFRSPGDSIGLAFERDWKPFQNNPGLATLSSTCKAHHLVRRVSFITRIRADLDFYDLRPGLARGSGGFFAWNMTENCTHGECERNLDLLCAESLIRVGEDSSRWESTIFCITVPWMLYRFWTTIRGHSESEPSGVGYLVDQGLLAEIPVKITGEDGQTWQRLWCPETVEGVKEIRAMFHEFSLPKPCGSFMLPRRFIVVVYKTGTADEWVKSIYKSLNMDPRTQIHSLGNDGEFDPPFHLSNPT